MSSLNQCHFIGHLGGNPEMRFTPSGDPVTTFTLACNRRSRQAAGERKEETEWINVVTWNKQAETCNKFLAKGDRVYVEGRLHTRSWDGQDGQKHSRTEIIASQVMFLNKKAGAEVAEREEIPF